MIADGLTLPFEQLVDWSQASVWVSEAELARARTPDDLLAKLPRDPATVRRLRRNVCLIHERHFRTEQRRVEGILLSALAFARRRACMQSRMQSEVPCRTDPAQA